MSDENPEAASSAAMTVAKRAIDLEALAIAGSTTLLGFPVPPTIARNVLDAVGAFVAATVDVPVAYLQTWAKSVRATGEARNAFTDSVVPVAVKAVSEDKGKTERAVAFLGQRMFREQTSRETVAQGAIEDLKTDPPKDDAATRIEEDWLHMFARHAETKTNADVQAYFSRVLAGEIRKPGSFSPETIEVLARMTPEVGRLFQQFCSITTQIGNTEHVFLFTEAFGNPGLNALVPVGFPYDTICRLQDAGLVRNELGANIDVTPLVLITARLGGQSLGLEPPKGPELLERVKQKRQLTGLRPTAAGAELRRIVHMTPNEVYVSKFLEWAKQLGLVPAAPSSSPSKDFDSSG